MPGPSSLASLAATCEDYNSDDSEAVPDTRKQANVAAKRTSHPSDGDEKTPVVVGAFPDVASDSGYSSHTAATMSSADSAQSLEARALPVRLHPSAPTTTRSASPEKRPRRPTLDDRKHRSQQSSPRKAPARAVSQSRRPRGEGEIEGSRPRGASSQRCTDPNCDCKDSQRRRPKPLAIDPRREPSYRTYPPPSPVLYPQSPRLDRTAMYNSGQAVIMPAQSQPRRRSSSAARIRPLSYHGGAAPEGYPMPGPYSSLSGGERALGPPPLFSAYHTQIGPYGMLSSTPPNAGFYQPVNQPPPTPTYEQPHRPALPQRASADPYSTRRPTSMYGPPVISYEQTKPSARNPSARFAAPPTPSLTSRFEDSTSSSEEEDEEDEDYDRQLMPPPRQPVRRPSIRQSLTNSHPYPGRQPAGMLPSPVDRDSRAVVRAETSSSRTSSARRPSLLSSVRTKATSYTDPSSNAAITVESAASSRRRMSYYGHERNTELAAKHHEAEAYDQRLALGRRGSHREREANRPRRDTESEPRRREATRGESELEAKTRGVEAYQRATRGGEVGPADRLTEQALRRSSNRVPSGTSDASSQRSRASSSQHDRVSRLSGSQRTAITQDGDGGFKMRIDTTSGFNISFDGDMGGKTISLRPQEEGMAELIIGNARGETRYADSRLERESLRSGRSGKGGSRRRAAEE